VRKYCSAYPKAVCLACLSGGLIEFQVDEAIRQPAIKKNEQEKESL
jgi:hypothetical protein